MRRRFPSLVVALAVALAVLSAAPLVPSASSQADDTEAERAAKEIADARDQANAAADAYFAAESRIDQLQSQAAALTLEIEELEQEVGELNQLIEDVAVNRYTRSGSGSVPILGGFKTPQEQVQRDALIDVINGVTAEDYDRYDSLSRDLADKKAQLERTKQEAVDEKNNLASLRAAAEQQVETLKEVEAQRLQDEAVQLALQAEQRERERQAAVEAEAIAAAVIAAGVPDDGDIDSGGQATGPVTGATGGGQTGAGGAGGRPGGAGGVDFGGVDWVCPTGDGFVAFADTWGAPRSGGRRHQGVDMIGARGTPILAVVDGVATPRTNTLGGTTISFTGNDGNLYYYAHLDGYGALGPVTKGTVIGFMGDTGNARDSVVHLHFEIRPGGGANANPYPTVRSHCV